MTEPIAAKKPPEVKPWEDKESRAIGSRPSCLGYGSEKGETDRFSKRMPDSKEAESLQESSPGLEWRSHANPGSTTSESGRSERAQESSRPVSCTLSECFVDCLVYPGSSSLGWIPTSLSGPLSNRQTL